MCSVQVVYLYSSGSHSPVSWMNPIMRVSEMPPMRDRRATQLDWPWCHRNVDGLDHNKRFHNFQPILFFFLVLFLLLIQLKFLLQQYNGTADSWRQQHARRGDITPPDDNTNEEPYKTLRPGEDPWGVFGTWWHSSIVIENPCCAVWLLSWRSRFLCSQRLGSNLKTLVWT